MSVGFTVVGAAFQGAGFGLTWWELARTQRREFPERVPLRHRAYRWVRRKLGIPVPLIARGALSGALNLRGSLTARVVRERPDELVERVRLLETEVDEVRQRQGEDRAALERLPEEIDRRVAASEAGMQARLDEMEQRQREQLRESLAFERLGVVLFTFGLVCSAVGSLA